MVDGRSRPRRRGPLPTPKPVSPEEFEAIFGSQGGGGYSDFFDTLFGGGRSRRASGGFGGQQYQYEPRPRKGRDSEYELDVTLQEAFNGSQRSLQFDDGRVIDAKIPRGVRTGSRVRLSGLGSPGAGGGEAGDLYLKINVLPDPTYERNGDDLNITIPVDIFTLLLGRLRPRLDARPHGQTQHSQGHRQRQINSACAGWACPS